jgi:two-component system, NtrC family, response regulator AtoC
MSFHNVLIVDDDAGMRQMLTLLLRSKGYQPAAVDSAENALIELEAKPYDAVLCDVRMPKLDGLSLLDQLQQRMPDLSVIMMSAYGSEEAAIEAMKRGAYDYISKPFRPDEVAIVLRKAEERERLRQENVRLRQQLGGEGAFAHLIGASAPMQELQRQIRKAAQVPTTVLIQGESGTGKELVAKALHELSPRAGMPFVAVNCGAIPDDLIESELFGHLKGAFTNASHNKKGLFSEADGGTIFLDEIGELPYPVQVSLLRTLQEDEIRRVGDTQSSKIDVRVIAATARNLEASVEAGTFRRDLFYRLNVLPLNLPALRQRAGDVPLLASYFVEKLNVALRRQPPVKAIDQEALAALAAHPWPGNVRELENVIERAMVMAEGEILDLAAFAGLRVGLGKGDTGLSIKRGVRALEIDLIQRALQQTRGNRTRAAALLEISHRALLYKLKEYGLGGRTREAEADLEPVPPQPINEP